MICWKKRSKEVDRYMAARPQTIEVKAEMMIRRPVETVFQAFIDPDVTTKFWFTRSSGKLEADRRVRWDWDMYGVGDDVYVRAIEDCRRIAVEYASDGTTAEWTFIPRSAGETMVTITSAGFAGDDESIVSQALDAMGGYTMVLCGLKAYLEHGIELNLVADRAPDAHVV